MRQISVREWEQALVHALPARAQVPSPLRFLVRIGNLEQIDAAYGRSAARHARQEVERITRAAFGREGTVLADEQGRLTVDLRVNHPTSRRVAGARLLQALRAALGSQPVQFNGETFHLAISVVGMPAADAADRAGKGQTNEEDALVLIDRIPFTGEAPDQGPDQGNGWGARYRRDMANVCMLFAGITGGRVDMAWQPVQGAPGADPSADEVLYYECLLRTSDASGAAGSPGCLIPAAERLGLVRALDEHMVSRVLDELDADPFVTLGVNISAQSTILDTWWAGIVERLSLRPDLARRLVIEITETAQIPSFSLATEFTNRMRGLGCRIALDDFGVGHASIRQLLALRPDIVKIDHFFINRAVASDQGWEAFRHVVGLARTLAPVVVVEGVEQPAHSRLAAAAGADWQQGFLMGLPTSVRSWRTSPGYARRAAEHYRACAEAADRVPLAREAFA